MEIVNSKGEIIADNDDASGVDPALVFTAPIDDLYLVFKICWALMISTWVRVLIECFIILVLLL